MGRNGMTGITSCSAMVAVSHSENVSASIFPQPVVPRPSVKQQVVSGGTGFLFSSKDYVITNHHLVRGRSSIKVTFLDGEVIDAKVVSVDKQNDIAFLKLSQSPKIPPSSLRIADSSTVKLGDKIFTIGYPASHLLGKSPKYSEGVINSIKGISDNPAYFQISVPIQPGNSGGPLFNERGEVIGITTSSLDSDLAKDAMGAVPQNINYAVKSLLIKNLMPTIPDIMLAGREMVVVPTEPEITLSGYAGIPRALIPKTTPAASIHIGPSKNLKPIAFEKGIVALNRETEVGSGGVMLDYGGILSN